MVEQGAAAQPGKQLFAVGCGEERVQAVPFSNPALAGRQCQQVQIVIAEHGGGRIAEAERRLAAATGVEQVARLGDPQPAGGGRDDVPSVDGHDGVVAEEVGDLGDLIGGLEADAVDILGQDLRITADPVDGFIGELVIPYRLTTG